MQGDCDGYARRRRHGRCVQQGMPRAALLNQRTHMQKLPAKRLDAQINVADSNDVRYWCRKLGCAQSDLLAAVKVLGPVALDVAKYVKRRAANN
jgi:hypothetical protein